MRISAVATTLLSVSIFWSNCAFSDDRLTNDASRAELFALMTAFLKGAATTHEERQQYAFPSAFVFPDDALWKNSTAQTDPRVDQVFGVDLSHHNAESCRCQINWALLSQQQVRFAYLKATQGVTGTDGFYLKYRTAARNLPAEHKIYVGAYHFLSADGSGEAQAAHFLKLVGEQLSEDDLPPTVDLEWDVRIGKDHKVIKGKDGRPYDFWTPLSGDEILRRVSAWLSLVRDKTGRRPFVYTNKVWWEQRIGSEEKIAALAGYGVWIADYSKSGRATEKPSVPNSAEWTLWQFGTNGTFKNGGVGQGRTVDTNVFNGSIDDFRRAAGIDK
ncbi:Lysozyme M1 [Burkholderia contaminans]|uniref:glycoside hydrolase family 25 protein n=1 Tax=Burkholderia contaminans TaxID=488447 RepID=UPI001452A89D|nr:GH25 family lysozyme [Burkholderia contaminans]VWD46805.1 Lysozyme M1 [Burkholderia contaminans]